METLHSEGRDLFEGSAWGGTFDTSSSFHHIDIHPSTFTFLGFARKGQSYHYVELPLGLKCAPRIFSPVTSHSVRSLRSPALGCRLNGLPRRPAARTSQPNRHTQDR